MCVNGATPKLEEDRGAPCGCVAVTNTGLVGGGDEPLAQKESSRCVAVTGARTKSSQRSHYDALLVD